MKIEIENSLVLIDESTDLKTFYQLNEMIQDCKKGILPLSGYNENLFVYKGSNHVAVHQVRHNVPYKERILLITEY